MIQLNLGVGDSIGIQPENNSVLYQRISAISGVNLEFKLPFFIEMPLLETNFDFLGQKYRLYKKAEIKRHGDRNLEFRLLLEEPAAIAKQFKLLNVADGTLEFPLTATPRQFLDLIVQNLTIKDSEPWSIGECLEAPEKVIAFNHDYIIDAISKIANEFQTEFVFEGRTIHLRKFEMGRKTPLMVSYGQGNGLLPGAGRGEYSESFPVQRLYIQGGSRNINWLEYGNKTLLLPKGQLIKYDGSVFEGHEDFDPTTAVEYKASANGLFLTKADEELTFGHEDSLDLTNIYPSRVGEVSAVFELNGLYDFVDASIPEDLNYFTNILPGQTLQVTFQSGQLSGRTFDVSHYEHNTRRFKLVQSTLDNIVMPNDVFSPRVGDKYAVFGMQMPDQYIRNDAAKSGASWELFKEAVKYKYENEKEKFTVTGELDGIWTKQNYTQIAHKIRPGYVAKFTDKDYLKNGELIRIVGVRTNVNSPYKPKIEISNATVTSGAGATIKKAQAAEVITNDQNAKNIEYTLRRYRDAIETMGMLENALFAKFDASISPIAVHTMQLLAGDESLQYTFVENDEDEEPKPIQHNVTFNEATKRVKFPAGVIAHYTLGVKDVSSKVKRDNIRFWHLDEFETFPLAQENKAYYGYIKASKANDSAEFLVSETAIGLEDVDGFYHFLNCIINSEISGLRSIVTFYGFTEILPGRIITDSIVSGDGRSWFNMLANSMRLDAGTAFFDFNSDGSGAVELRGVFIQSPSGTKQRLTVYRGEWVEGTYYFIGDEVKYTNPEGKTGYYVYTNTQSTNDKHPTDADFWELRISDGDRGPFVVSRGEYSPTKVYQGSATSIDAVKFGNSWYMALETAGSFGGYPPTDTTKWKRFGGNFENIATDLLLANRAAIGKWWVEDGQIVSRLTADDPEEEALLPKIILDATLPEIRIQQGGGLDLEYSKISASGAVFRGKGQTISETGDGQIVSAAASAGLARGLVNLPDYEAPWGLSFLAGIFGDAENLGTAPSFGGFFNRLATAGLVLKPRYLSNGDTVVNIKDVLISMFGGGYSVTLPETDIDGDLKIFTNMGSAQKRIYAPAGSVLYNGTGTIPYATCNNGNFCIFYSMYVVVSGVRTLCWFSTRIQNN